MTRATRIVSTMALVWWCSGAHADSALRVVQHSPEGVEQAPPAISVTFDQPMIPVASVGETRQTQPLVATPAIDGTWKWQGTTTLQLTPKVRLAAATRYRISVPAGTRSLVGGAVLAREFSYTFDTPLPQVTSVLPNPQPADVGLDPTLFLSFNQRVSGEKIAPFVTLRDAAGGAVPLRAIPRTQWNANARFAGYSTNEAEKGTLFVPARPLQPNTTYRISVRAGVVGDEGPLPSAQAFESTFTTYAPLAVKHVQCGACNYGEAESAKTCTVGSSLCIAFNHELKVKSADSAVSVTPLPKGFVARISGNNVELEGKYVAEQIYRVAVPAGITDNYGQALANAWSRAVKFVHLPTEIEPLIEAEALIEARGRLALPLHLMNADTLDVTAYPIADEQLNDARYASQQPMSSESFAEAMRKLKPKSKPTAWQARPGLPADKSALYALSLKALVEQRGGGTYLIVVGGANNAVLVQVSDLGITARYDNQRMVVLVTSVATGRPLAGVSVRVNVPGHATVKTGADGVATLAAIAHGDETSFGEVLVLASIGGAHPDRSYVTARGYGDDGRGVSFNWGRDASREYHRTFFYPDRDLYRPGETVYLYGVDREYVGDQTDRFGVPRARDPIEWKAASSRGRELAKGKVTPTLFGTFFLSFVIPASVDLGALSVTTPLGSTQVNVEEYRAPEFLVGVTLAPPSLALFGEALNATVSGRYLFGAPMKQANVKWTLYSSQARFSPPNASEFHFGTAIERYRGEERFGWYERGPQAIATGQAKLDDQGVAHVSAPLPASAGQLDPQSLIFEAQVTDVSRQAAAGQATRLAHPTDRYVGVRIPDGAGAAAVNEPTALELVLVDVDGKRVAGVPLSASATMQSYVTQGGLDDDGNANTRSEPKTITVKPCAVTSAGEGNAARCVLTFPQAGTYLLEVHGVDSRQRPVITRDYVDVAGADRIVKTTQAGLVQVHFDRAKYRAGQTATVSLRAPFADGVALLTTERRGLLAHQVITIARYRGTAKITVNDAQIPNLEIAVTAVAARQGTTRAAWANGAGTIVIEPVSKQLHVVVRPAKPIARPGEEVAIDVNVTDDQGQPVAASVSLVAVDEAVLSMTGFATPNALPFFHYARESGVALAALLKHLLPETPPAPSANERKAKRASMEDSKMAESAAGPSPVMSSPAKSASGPKATGARSVLLTTPAARALTTDARGHATFKLRLPDNLTRFRLMAVASDAGDRFGSGEDTITVQKPLQLRPSLPRFVNAADAFSAGVLVDNQSAQAGTAEVTLALDGAGVELAGPASQRVTLAAGETNELTFAVRASAPGSATFHYTVQLGGERDAVDVTLPIKEPASKEAFATYGTTLDKATEGVSIPADVYPTFGGVQLTLASSALSGLEDAAKYLLEYPYGCVEQMSSKAMPTLVMGELVAALGLGDTTTLATGRANAATIIAKIISGQRSDGSWGTWSSSNDEGRVDLTSYVLLVLRRGKDAGFTIPVDTVDRATGYLAQWMTQHPAGDKHLSAWQRRWTNDIHAFALYVLGDWGQPQPDLAAKLYPFANDLDLFARAWLAAVFHRLAPTGNERNALYRELQNRVIQTASSARFVETQSEALQLLMHSSSRTDAIVLLVMLELEPQNVLVTKLVRGLMDARINGRWDTTQSSSYALYALSRYFTIYEHDPTAFIVRATFGKQLLAEHTFPAKTLRQEHVDVPMAKLALPRRDAVTLTKTGSGRLYYRLGIVYAPRNAKLAPLDQGMTISRRYESITNPDDVVHEKDGSYSIKAGAIVRVHLDLVVQDRRFYVAVDDALPAGLELVNSAYKTTARSDSSNAASGDEAWPFAFPSWQFTHRELRDDRSLHFADELTPGKYQLNLVARATVRGNFAVPPPRVEEMYHPEVFGRGATDRVNVK